MSDHYYEVGELEFPKGKGSAWWKTVLPEADRDEVSRRTVSELFASLEGDVDAVLRGEKFRARIVLVDGAWFEPQDAIELALDEAARLGATGAWYSGSYFSGDHSSFAGGMRREKNARPLPFLKWIEEAGAKSAAAPARVAAAKKPATPTLVKNLRTSRKRVDDRRTGKSPLTKKPVSKKGRR